MTTASSEPFPGPRPFLEAEEGIFFGRDAEINDVADLISTYPFVLLYSQSGAGKSSLIQAGLIPALKQKGAFIFPIARVGGASSDISSRGRSIFVDRVLSALDETPANKAADISSAVSDRLRMQPHPYKQYILIVDQAEELFTTSLDRWQERGPLFQQLGEALARHETFRILMVMREEYLGDVEAFGQCTPYELKIRYRLERLRREDAREAVMRPLGTFGWTMEEAGLSHLLNNLQMIRVIRNGRAMEAPGEYIEPVHLQVVCRDLWHKRTGDEATQVLSVPSEIDHLDGSLMRFYDESLKHVAERHRCNESDIRKWFQDELVTPRGTRRVLFKGEGNTGGLPNRVVEELESEHLIRSEPRAGGEVCELTHDRMIAPVTKANAKWHTDRRKRRIPFLVGLTAVVLIALLMAVGPTERWWALQHASQHHKQADDAQQKADHALAAERNPLHAKELYETALANLEQSSVPGEVPSDANYAAVAYINERLAQICLVSRSVKCSPASTYLQRSIEANDRLGLKLRVAGDKLELADYRFRRGETAAAEQLYAEVVNLVRSSRDEEARTSRYGVVGDETFQKESRAITGLGLVKLRRGDWVGARDSFAQGMSALRRHDELGEWATLIVDLGAAQIEAHSYHDAESTYGELMYKQRFRTSSSYREDLVPLLRGYGLARMLSAGSRMGKEFSDGREHIQRAYNAFEVKRSGGVAIKDETNQLQRAQMIEAEQYEQGFNCLALAAAKVILASKNPNSWIEVRNNAEEARDIFHLYDDLVDENLAKLLISQSEQHSYADTSVIERAKADEASVRHTLQQEQVQVQSSVEPALLASSHRIEKME